MEPQKVEIVYYRSTKNFSFSQLFSLRTVNNYRYYRNKKEYAPILIKESIVNWLVISLLLWGIYMMVQTGQTWSTKLSISFLAGSMVISPYYIFKMRNFHVVPKRIYEQLELMFSSLEIDSKLIEVEPFCFVFKKKKYDFRLEYKRSISKSTKSFCKLTVYFRYMTVELKDLIKNRFNYQMYNEWSINKAYPYMAVCWIPGSIPAAEFAQIFERLLPVLEEMGFMPSAHLEDDELSVYKDNKHD